MTTILKSLLLLFCGFLIWMLSLGIKNEDDKISLGFLWTSLVLVCSVTVGIIVYWIK